MPHPSADHDDTSTVDQHGIKRRTVLSLGALAAAATVVPSTASAAAAEQPPLVIRSGALEVELGREFPRVVAYTDRSTGAVVHGQPDPIRWLLVNGARETPKVTVQASGDRADYTLRLRGGTTIEVRISVSGSILDYRVTRIADTDALRVGTLQIPELRLLSVRSTQPGATLLGARVDLNKDGSGDTWVKPTTDTAADSTARGCAYAVVATDRLGAAIEANTVYDAPTKEAGTTWENGRFWHQAIRRDGWVETGLAPGEWTYRPARAPLSLTHELPYARVVVTGDRNDDGVVDWQDAAIAMRDIAVQPRGADDQHLRVVPHIPFNFASQATNPFLASLDQVKRVSLATDGLRQFTLLKGYQSEGHDSAHPDYAGNYNHRAGGIADLNTLVERGARWASDFAVHVNATEAYPVANAFSETLVDEQDEQWDWLDQSYRIDSRRDLVSGDIAGRLADLRRDAHPALNMLYFDVFRESGWNSDGLQTVLADQGWAVTTEWGHGLERSAVWSHWATETDYGADASRGLNSRLIRMVRHHQKDVFADKWPDVLPTTRMGNFEGWRGKADWGPFYRQIWTTNLPAKFLQAFPIRTWGEREVTFFAPRAVVSRAESGTRVVTVDGHEVLRGDAYLLPWTPGQLSAPPKLYHYNASGGRTTWRLPSGWARRPHVYVYRLTDQGRRAVGRVRVRGGQVTLDAQADQPYVVYPRPAQRATDPRWGEGTPLVDPGFNAGDLRAWRVEGPAQVRRNARGDYELELSGPGAASVSQRLRRLEPGTYVASVQVEVGAKAGERRRAALEVTSGGRTVSTWTDTSTAENFIAADVKHGSRMQRMFVEFAVGRGGGGVTLALTAAAGSARVLFDNVRVAPGRLSRRDGAVAYEDFENVPQGWGPFVKGDAGGRANDPRTHIAQRHEPFTQSGWNGKAIDDVISGDETLKSRGEKQGLVYRTVPHLVRFEAGKTYRVSFRYQCETAGDYAWVTGVDDPAAKELSVTPMPAATATRTHAYEFTAPSSGDAWVGLRKVRAGGKTEFVLDEFEVVER